MRNSVIILQIRLTALGVRETRGNVSCPKQCRRSLCSGSREGGGIRSQGYSNLGIVGPSSALGHIQPNLRGLICRPSPAHLTPSRTHIVLGASGY